MKKSTLNYIIDIIIAIAFIVSAVTVIVLAFNPHGGGSGFGGGRGFTRAQPAAGLTANIQVWRDIHTVFSILLAAGALGHLMLHLKWMKCMTVNLFKKKKNSGTKEACSNI